MSNVMKLSITVFLVCFIFGLPFVFLTSPKDKPIITNCTFTTGIITAKQQYCAQDCRYTLVIVYDNKATEVDVPKEKYEYGIIGSSIEILTNCK